jgi:hypothetical protein
MITNNKNRKNRSKKSVLTISGPFGMMYLWPGDIKIYNAEFGKD